MLLKCRYLIRFSAISYQTPQVSLKQGLLKNLELGRRRIHLVLKLLCLLFSGTHCLLGTDDIIYSFPIVVDIILA